jgi:transposase
MNDVEVKPMVVNEKAVSCPVCGEVCKRHSVGVRILHDLGESRPRRWRVVFGKYHCLKCCKIFSVDVPLAMRRYRYTKGVMAKALALSKDHTFEKTSEILLSQFHIRVPMTTIHEWLNISEEIGDDGVDSGIVGSGTGAGGSVGAVVG